MKKKQLIFEISTVVFVFLCCLLACFFTFGKQKDGKTLIIKGNGKIIASYPLDTDRYVLINKTEETYIVTDGIEENYNLSDFPTQYNLICVKDGEVSVIEADCPAKGTTRCTNQKKIKYAGRSIICRENGLVITVSGGDEANGTDASSK